MNLLDTIFSALTETSVTTTANLAIGKMHICSGTSSDYTVTLPAATTALAGQMLVVRISTACTKIITVDGNGSETIDGATTRLMWAGESAILMCDGSNWTKISGKTIPFRCKMYMSATNQEINSSESTQVRLNAAVTNGAHQELMADTGNNKILIKRGGAYNLYGRIWAYEAATTYNNCSVEVYDGSTYYINQNGLVFPTTAEACGLALANLAAGSYLVLKAYIAVSGAGTTFVYGGNTNLSHLIAQEIPSW